MKCEVEGCCGEKYPSQQFGRSYLKTQLHHTNPRVQTDKNKPGRRIWLCRWHHDLLHKSFSNEDLRQMPISKQVRFLSNHANPYCSEP